MSNPETTRPIYCPHRGGLKQECETPNACAGGADCRRDSNEQLYRTADDDRDLPNEDMRRIGGNWVRRYGHMMQDDPDFVAAALYRVMRLARRDPKYFELSLLQEHP